MRSHFDDILRHLGEFGRYQKWVFFLLCLPGISHGVRMMISVFLLNIPPHRCFIPGYDNDTYAVQSHFHSSLINDTIPYVRKDGKWGYDQCHMFVNESVTEGGNRTTVKCDKWVYDKSIFQSTVSTELNFVCDDAILATHSQMIFMGGYFFGSFASGALGDKIGRKGALYLCIVFHLAGGVALNWSVNFVMFVIFRFINGAATAGVFTTCFVMGMEIVGPSKRVWTGVMVEVFFAIGMCLLAGVGYFVRDWHSLELAMSIPLAFFLTYWWFVPESPRWLLNEARSIEAEVIIRRAANVNKVMLPEKIFERPVLEKDENEKKGSFFDLFTSWVMCIRTIIIFFNWLVVSMVYYGLSLNSDNLGAGSFHLNFFLVGLVEFPAYALTIALLDRLGRKILHCSAMILGGGACILTIFTILYADKSLQWVTVLLAMIGKLGAAAGFAIIYIFSSELFPTVIRHSATGASSSWARVGGMIAPYIVDWGKLVGGDFGRALPLLMFGSFSVAAGLLALLLPETLNKDLPESIEDGRRFGRESPETKRSQDEEKKGGVPLLPVGDGNPDVDWKPIYKNNKNATHA